MSVEALAWAFGQDLQDPCAKLVLVSLADEAIRSGLVIGLHQRVISDFVGTTRPTVARKLTLLREADLIEQRWPEDNASSNLYLVKVKESWTIDRALLALEVEDPKAFQAVSALYPGRGGPSKRGGLRLDTQEVLTLGFDLEESGSTRKARARDPIFDAIVEVTQAVVASESSMIARAKQTIVAELTREWERTPEEGEVAAEIRVRAGLYRSAYPQAALTPTSLTKHWNRVTAERQKAADSADVIRTLGLDPEMFE